MIKTLKKEEIVYNYFDSGILNFANQEYCLSLLFYKIILFSTPNGI